MASQSSNPSSSFDHRLTIIVDDLPPMMAPIRSRSRGSRLRNLGFISSWNTSSSKKSSSKSASYSKAKYTVTPRSSSKIKDQSKPFLEPLVLEIVPQEVSFVSNCEAWNNEVTSIAALNHVDHYSYIIKSGLLPLVCGEYYWKPDFPIIAPGIDDCITTYHEGYSFINTYRFTLGFKPQIVQLFRNFAATSMFTSGR